MLGLPAVRGKPETIQLFTYSVYAYLLSLTPDFAEAADSVIFEHVKAEIKNQEDDSQSGKYEDVEEDEIMGWYFRIKAQGEKDTYIQTVNNDELKERMI